MISVLSSLFFFLLALGILITFHEFGHFWVARKAGVKVLRFSVGFGKPIWSKRSGVDNTEYVLAALPFGGYVRMLDEREGEVAPDEQHRAFNRQSLSKRVAIVVAGPLFNFLLAIAAFWLIFVIGVTGMKPIVGDVSVDSIAAKAGLQKGDVITNIGGKETPTWQAVIINMLNGALDTGDVVLNVTTINKQQVERHLYFDGIPDDLNRGGLLDFIGIRPSRPAVPPIIGKLAPGGAAGEAGIEVGDLIVSADGKSVDDWERWVDYVRERPDTLIKLKVEREGQQIDLLLTPSRLKNKDGDIGRIGAGIQLQAMPKELISVVKYGPIDAIGEAVVKTWNMSVLTLNMISKMLVGDVSISNLSGPISIAKYAGYSASIGLVSFLSFLAIVSISLGVLNLLPIPLLDGGHLLYYLVEFIKGSPVSEATQLIGQKVGIIMLLAMMVLAFYNDIVRLFVE